MYQVIENKVVLSVRDWKNAGLNRHQFERDSKDGRLAIVRRGLHGNMVFDVRSVIRPGRRQALEAAYGPVPEPPDPARAQGREKFDFYRVETDMAARTFFLSRYGPDGEPLNPSRVAEYTNRASIFLAIRRGLERQTAAFARNNGRMNMGTYRKEMAEWFPEQVEQFPCEPYGNPHSLERAFKKYLNEGYATFIHGNHGNDAARRVSMRTKKKLLPALRTLNNKPFINETHRLYIEFIHGEKGFRTPKNRVKGDRKEKEYEYIRIVQDDPADIEEHNKSMHPRQKTYPGMTREEVFLQKYNRKLPKPEPYYLYRSAGNSR
jgi:hypothetical protein